MRKFRAPSDLGVSSPPSHPSTTFQPSTSIYICSAACRFSSTSSYVPAVSICKLFSSDMTLSSFSSLSVVSTPSHFRRALTLSILRCHTACVDAFMPALRHVHSWRLPHAVFAWSPAALITSLYRARRSVSPIPTGRNPGLLSSVTRRHAISAQ